MRWHPEHYLTADERLMMSILGSRVPQREADATLEADVKKEAQSMTHSGIRNETDRPAKTLGAILMNARGHMFGVRP